MVAAQEPSSVLGSADTRTAEIKGSAVRLPLMIRSRLRLAELSQGSTQTEFKRSKGPTQGNTPTAQLSSALPSVQEGLPLGSSWFGPRGNRPGLGALC